MENNTEKTEAKSIDDLINAVDIKKVTEQEIVADIITGIQQLAVKATVALVTITVKPIDQTVHELVESIQQLGMRATIGIKLLARKKELEIEEAPEETKDESVE